MEIIKRACFLAEAFSTKKLDPQGQKIMSLESAYASSPRPQSIREL